MSVLTRPQRDRLSRDDLSPLGKDGSGEYVEFANREYRLSQQPLGEGLAGDPLKRDEIRVIEPITSIDRDGYEARSTVIYRGLQVPSGTWARRESEVKARKAKAVRRQIPASVDVIPRLEIAQVRGGNVVRVGPGSKLGRNVWNQADGNIALHDPREYGLRGPAPTAMFTPLVEPARTVREVMERIAKSGTVLVVQGGRLVASPPGGRWPRGVAEAVEKLEPMLVGILSGDPLPCAFRHDVPTEAVTLLAPACPACAEHAA
jgi:hypothetical protein